ncbi:hypothetical protein CWM24_24595, partial [Escherichia coli]
RFKVARGIFMDLWRLANDESCLRHQTFWHSWQGPLLEGQQSSQNAKRIRLQSGAGTEWSSVPATL